MRSQSTVLRAPLPYILYSLCATALQGSVLDIICVVLPDLAGLSDDVDDRDDGPEIRDLAGHAGRRANAHHANGREQDGVVRQLAEVHPQRAR